MLQVDQEGYSEVPDGSLGEENVREQRVPRPHPPGNVLHRGVRA